MPEPRGEFATKVETAKTDWSGAGTGDGGDRAAEAASELGRGARRMADEASRTMRDAKERVTAAYGRTAETAERAYHEARGFAKENPGTAAAVTFATGLGVGLMLAPRSRFHAYRRGLVPVVAIALANAVLDVFDQGH